MSEPIKPVAQARYERTPWPADSDALQTHIGMEPDTQAGAFVGCECSACREARLADTDRITFTAAQLVEAWEEGVSVGLTRCRARIDEELRAYRAATKQERTHG